MIFERFGIAFRDDFRSLPTRLVDSLPQGPNPVSCGQGHTKQGSGIAHASRKSTENRSERASRASRAKNTRLFRSRRRLGIDFGRLEASPGAPGYPFRLPWAALGSLRALPGGGSSEPGSTQDRPTGLFERPSRPKTHFERQKSTEKGARAAPRTDSGRFSSDSGSIFGPIFPVFRRGWSARFDRG